MRAPRQSAGLLHEGFLSQTQPDGLDAVGRPGRLCRPRPAGAWTGCTQPDGLDGLSLTTDQKAGGSSPSERATRSPW